MKLAIPLLLAAGASLSLLPASAVEPTAASRHIDELLAKDWQAAGLKPNAPAQDDVFLRRVYLDVIGRIPTYDEATAFLDDQDTHKRAKLIDELLGSEGYVHHFFNYWADVLRAQSAGIGSDLGAQAYLNYLRQSLREDKPYDEMVRDLVAKPTTCFENGAVGYYIRDRGMPLDNLASTARIFLGTRIECAQCHNHPFDKWSQMDFYRMAAFSHNMTTTNYRSNSQTEASKLINKDKELDPETRDLMRRALNEAFRPLQGSEVVENKGKLQLPQDYKYKDAKPRDVVQAAVMFGKPVQVSVGSDLIHEYAAWMTSPENPRFTTVVANRLWKQVFGLALIEPLDEMLDATQPSNPELMEFLRQQMIALHYDMKAYLRMLLNTETYQRECSPTEATPGAAYHFTGPLFRRMTAEQIWDSFITLVNPSPDQSNWTQRERERREMTSRHKLAQLLDATEPALLYDASKEVAGLMKAQNQEFEGLRKELAEAREKNDKPRIQEIQRKLGDTQRYLRESISKSFYEAAEKSSNEEVKKQLAEASAGGPMEMAMMNLMGAATVKPSEMPVSAEELDRMQRDAKTLGIKGDKAVLSYENYRRGLHQNWCRAAELTSPAPRGHFLREFGQSDRDTVENASAEASVPQALTLMNGPMVTQLVNPWSAVSTTLRRVTTTSEKADILYLSLFGRHADAEEQALILHTVDSAKDAKTVWDDILCAAISTKQFIFIQ